MAIRSLCELHLSWMWCRKKNSDSCSPLYFFPLCAWICPGPLHRSLKLFSGIFPIRMLNLNVEDSVSNCLSSLLENSKDFSLRGGMAIQFNLLCSKAHANALNGLLFTAGKVFIFWPGKKIIPQQKNAFRNPTFGLNLFIITLNMILSCKFTDKKLRPKKKNINIFVSSCLNNILFCDFFSRAFFHWLAIQLKCLLKKKCLFCSQEHIGKTVNNFIGMFHTAKNIFVSYLFKYFFF